MPLSVLMNGSHRFDGLPEQFDNIFMKGNILELIKFCDKISLNSNASVKISLIGDNPEVISIINKKLIANQFIIKKGIFKEGILFYKFDDSLGGNISANKYLALTWKKINDDWFLESAISTSDIIKITNIK